MKMIELEFDPVKALAQVTIMKNTTLSKNPDHKFIEYFENIEATLRTMREKNLKLLGRVEAAERQIDKFSQLGNNQIEIDYAEDVEQQDQLTDEAGLKIVPPSKLL